MQLIPYVLLVSDDVVTLLPEASVLGRRPTPSRPAWQWHFVIFDLKSVVTSERSDQKKEGTAGTLPDYTPHHFSVALCASRSLTSLHMCELDH